MARMKTTLKSLVVKKKEVKRRRGGRAQAVEKMPWEARGWTRQLAAAEAASKLEQQGHTKPQLLGW